MARRSSLAVLVGAFLFALAPAASAQLPPPFFAFEHDSSRDGTPNEVRSGFYGGDDGNNADGDPLADRVPNSYEFFDFKVPDGSQNGSFTVHVQWADSRVDLDLFVYRLKPNGEMVSNNVARSAQGGTNSEDAQHRPPVGNVQPDTYRIVVDNWCSRNNEGGGCYTGADPPNEDDFSGEVRFGGALISNPLPSVSLTGPKSGTVGQQLTFTANANDDEPIDNYAFDFDGDGRFESDNLRSNTATHRFETPGVVNVGVRVIDQDGDRAFGILEVSISGAGAAGGAAGGGTTVVGAPGRPLLSFKLSRPVFGGPKRRSLVVRYRLRERANVTVSLYRGKKRIRRLSQGAKQANRTYRMVVKPGKLRRATYTVRLSLRTVSGKRQRSRLSSKRL